MRKIRHITARLDPETLRALDTFPGASRSERIAYCVHSTSVIAHVTEQISRVGDTLGIRLDTLTESVQATRDRAQNAQAPALDQATIRLSVSAAVNGVRDEIANLLKSGDSSKVSAALAAVIEHSLLPQAAMDRKQPLKAALDQLRGGPPK